MIPLLDPPDAQRASCCVCGHSLLAILVGPSAPAVCAGCGPLLQEADAARLREGDDPPPSAYREVTLPENWR